MFSNRSAFTINSQNRFSGANYVLTIEGPALFQSLGIRRVHRFAQFCLRAACFGLVMRGLDRSVML
jgi:hypothetical protein